MSRIEPVILSGGAGTRLWPASRTLQPKQLLPLLGDLTMLQNTALRLRGADYLANEAIVVCNEQHREEVANQLQAIDQPASIILEPVGRNTAPAVALAALHVLQHNEDASTLLLVMPADHVIRRNDAFLEAVSAGRDAAENGRLITFGVVPTHAHTGYGYIEAEVNSHAPSVIRRFVEKPDRARASQFVVSGRFFWNAGIFLFRADTFIDELERFSPEIVEACRRSMGDVCQQDGVVRPDAATFAECPADSIDYAVMEKTKNAAMVPLDAGWNDVGSWSALHEVSERDSSGNVMSGDVIAHGCSDSYVSAGEQLVAAVGLRNIVVVVNDDAIMVSSRERSEDVKAIAEELRAKGRPEINAHSSVSGDWGRLDSLPSSEGSNVRRLRIKPGAVVQSGESVQFKQQWVVTLGRGALHVDGDAMDLAPGISLEMAPGVAWRLVASTDESLDIIVIQHGCGVTGQAYLSPGQTE